jgi:hypothetical protein
MKQIVDRCVESVEFYVLILACMTSNLPPTVRGFNIPTAVFSIFQTEAATISF